jgi:ankyrin repeat protein
MQAFQPYNPNAPLWLGADGVADDNTGIRYLHNVCEMVRFTNWSDVATLDTVSTKLMCLDPVVKTARVNVTDDRNATILHYAVMRKMENLAHYLLVIGIDYTIRDMHGKDALMCAAEVGSVVILEYIRKKSGVALSTLNQTSDGCSMLNAAASRNHVNMVQHLLKSGVDRCARDSVGWTALHHAVANGSLQCVKQLVHRENRNLINMVTSNGDTALHFAAEGGWNDILNILCDYSASTCSQNASGKTPLHMIPDSDTMQCILDRHDFNWHNLEIQDSHGTTPLIHAAYRCNIDLATTLIYYYRDRMLNLDMVDNGRNTALHWFAFHGIWWVVQLLIRFNADVLPKNVEELTALGMAEEMLGTPARLYTEARIASNEQKCIELLEMRMLELEPHIVSRMAARSRQASGILHTVDIPTYDIGSDQGGRQLHRRVANFGIRVPDIP